MSTNEPARVGDPALLADIRAGLLAAGFTSDGVLTRLGPMAYGALAAGITLPARRALGQPQEVLDLLITAFLIAGATPASQWQHHPSTALLLQQLEAAGLVETSNDQVWALVALHPYAGSVPADQVGVPAAGHPADGSVPSAPSAAADWYLACDLGRPTSPDHVLGPAGAAVTLARITPRRPGQRALDLGCGGGIQAVHAATHATSVVATDTNPRALWFTEVSAHLSGCRNVQVELGSLYEPVAGQLFDLIVSNPPFVISPGHRFTYRDAGLPGDELSRQVVRGAASHLAPGGIAAVLVNWLLSADEDWRDRVAGWVTQPDVSVWIVLREVTSVLDYSLMWLQDAGLRPGGAATSSALDPAADSEFDTALGQWLDDFAAQDAQAVGFGWVLLCREPTDSQPWLVIDDLSRAARLPTGPEVSDVLAGWSAVNSRNVVELLETQLGLDPRAVVTTDATTRGWPDYPVRVGRPGEIGPGGWRDAVLVDQPVLAALRRPEVPIGVALDQIAAAQELDPGDLLAAGLIAIRELLALGLVHPVG